MTSKAPRLWILGVWTLALFAGASFIPRPAADDEEYLKWFIFGLLAFGVRWFLDWLLVLPIAFSLARRRGLPRLWILGFWTLVAVVAAWLTVIRPVTSLYPASEYMDWLPVGLRLFAFPWLFVLLVTLWIALWLEEKIGTRSSSIQLNPHETKHN